MAKKRATPRPTKQRQTPVDIPPPPAPVRPDTPPSEARPAPSEVLPTVVAIGASAGGLDAFSQILESLPAKPNAAFIFVQHLSPQHESALPALLAARTPLPVVQASDGMKIEPNRVYV